MKISKIVISTLLLLTYMFGFAHSAIPHVNGGHGNLHTDHNQLSTHNHSHHQHAANEKTVADHEHLSHDNHFDADLADYVLCVLNDMEHRDANCNVLQYIPIKRSNKNLVNLSQTTLVALVHTFFINEELPIVSHNHYTYDAQLCASPPLDNSPNRGPPTLTC